MKVAVISDIHGNLPALEAVMDDIKKRAIDKIICLGDLIGKGPSAEAVIDICRNECEIVIRGNWDHFTYKAYIASGQTQADTFDERTLWYLNSIGSQYLEYLGSLPHSTAFYLNGKLIRLFHAHPQNFNRYFQDSPLEQRLELFEFGGYSEVKKLADVAVYGDIHSTYMQILQGKHLINVGSVGNPLDTTQASYVILEGDEKENSSFGVQFIRVSYDIEKAIALAVKAKVPDLDGYISELKTAQYFYRG